LLDVYLEEDLTKTENIDNQSSDVISLKNAFAKKYNKPFKSVFLIINNSQDPYYSGIVDFDNSGLSANFFAYKNKQEFIIVGVENGVISCESINNYNFPNSIIPTCYDSSNGSVINR